MRARVNAEGAVELFPNQSSGVLTSAVWADGLVDNPSGQVVQRGDTVRLLPLSALVLAMSLVVLAGEITTHTNVDYIQVARDTIKRIGYDNTE